MSSKIRKSSQIGSARWKCHVEVPRGSGEDTPSWVELPRAQKMLHGSATWKPYQDIAEEEDLPNYESKLALMSPTYNSPSAVNILQFHSILLYLEPNKEVSMLKAWPSASSIPDRGFLAATAPILILAATPAQPPTLATSITSLVEQYGCHSYSCCHSS